MPDESYAQLAIGRQTRRVRLSAERGYRRMPHQAPELRRTLAERGITKRLLDHPEAVYSIG